MLRNLKDDANMIAAATVGAPCEIKLRENRGRLLFAAFDVLVRRHGSPRGRCVATIVAWPGDRFPA